MLARLFAALALLTLFAAPAVVPHAAAGEPGSVPFLQVRIDSVTPEVVTTTSEPIVTVTGSVLNVGDRPVRDVMVRLEHAAAVTSSAGLRTNLAGNVDQFEPVADFITVAPELLRGQDVPFTLVYPLRSAELPSLHIDEPGVYPVHGQRQRHPRLRRPRPPRRRPLPAAGARCAARARGRLRRRRADGGGAARHLQTRSAHHAVAAGGPAAAGGGRARWHHTGAADRRRPRDLAGARRAARHPAVGGRLRDQPAGRPRRCRCAARCVWPSTPTCWSPSTR